MQIKRTFLTITVLFTLLLANFAQAQKQEPPIVRLIYFFPSDREPNPFVEEVMDELIKDVQQLYADQMESHGFGRKTIQIETDPTGNTIIHRVKGRFTDSHYSNSSDIADIWREIEERFNLSKNIYFTVVDMNSKTLGKGGPCALGRHFGSAGGMALIPFSGNCVLEINLAIHELGHAFGLIHGFGNYGLNLSFCEAEWFNAHRAFNRRATPLNHNTTIKMLPPSLVSPSNAIRLRFELTDPDGLHQAQLEALDVDAQSQHWVHDCKGLNGNMSRTIEFVTTGLTSENKNVYLKVIDVHGNFVVSQGFPIDITSLLPSPRVVSIPDTNLAAVVKDKIGNITTHTMLNLWWLNVPNRGITNLKGLEHAHNLKQLRLDGNAVSDFSPLEGLTQLGLIILSDNSISDVSSLTGLTQLKNLNLGSNNISDVSPLAQLTQLTKLELYSNNISDVSPLAQLTQLEELNLGSNNISDVSPLAQLTQLKRLSLGSNNISDVSPLAQLTQLEELYLSSINTSDMSPLAQLTQLERLSLGSNNISDVSPLAQLTQLEYLGLGFNNINDVSPLAQLTQLRYLYIVRNNISDVSPLVGLNLKGFSWVSTGLLIWQNPLNYTSVHTHIPAMQARGIEISFDDRAHPALVKVSGDIQEGEASTTLTTPLVVKAMDEHGTPMPGLSITFRVIEGGGRLSGTTATTDTNGRAQTTLTLGANPGVNRVRVTASQITYPVTFIATATEPSRLTGDVNGDGTLNVLDLITIVSRFDQTGPNSADVNGDGIVNLLDLVLVAGAFEDGAAAAPILQSSEFEGFTAKEIQNILTQARQLALTDPTYLRGIMVLEQLLFALIPKETALLANYPNPFNPETWIPYQLANPAEVTLHIYAVNGELVRTLALGHQPAGMYQTRTRAAYWDGRNALGEPVASGVYFYTLTAGDYTATRKMLIRK